MSRSSDSRFPRGKLHLKLGYGPWQSRCLRVRQEPPRAPVRAGGNHRQRPRRSPAGRGARCRAAGVAARGGAGSGAEIASGHPGARWRSSGTEPSTDRPRPRRPRAPQGDPPEPPRSYRSRRDLTGPGGPRAGTGTGIAAGSRGEGAHTERRSPPSRAGPGHGSLRHPPGRAPAGLPPASPGCPGIASL